MPRATEKTGPTQSNNDCGYDPSGCTVTQQEYLQEHHLKMNLITTSCAHLNTNVPMVPSWWQGLDRSECTEEVYSCDTTEQTHPPSTSPVLYLC